MLQWHCCSMSKRTCFRNCGACDAGTSFSVIGRQPWWQQRCATWWWRLCTRRACAPAARLPPPGRRPVTDRALPLTDPSTTLPSPAPLPNLRRHSRLECHGNAESPEPQQVRMDAPLEAARMPLQTGAAIVPHDSRQPRVSQRMGSALLQLFLASSHTVDLRAGRGVWYSSVNF